MGSYGPLIGQLLDGAAPAIGAVLSLALAATPLAPIAGLAGSGVTALIPRINAALGLAPDAPPEKTAAAIAADPEAAKAALATLNEEHSFTLSKLKQSDDAAIAMQAQQVAIDTVESQNPSWFIAGWRPALGWCLGLIVVASFLLPYPIWLLHNFGYSLTDPPQLNRDAIIILSALLGIQTLTRTWEKGAGTDTKAMGGVKVVTTKKVTTNK